MRKKNNQCVFFLAHVERDTYLRCFKYTKEDIMHVGVLLALGTVVAGCVLVDGFSLWGKENYKNGKCAGQDFDMGTHICCVDQLYERKTWNECCCGYKVLDTAIEKCCNNFVIQLADKCLHDPVKQEAAPTPAPTKN
ncbi:hypothetical protein LSAT2_009069 [Lamellibrachia satsuma]|nr:hypothetical protein LSAT2_009069 [Lamellibrachia satsuma]